MGRYTQRPDTGRWPATTPFTTHALLNWMVHTLSSNVSATSRVTGSCRRATPTRRGCARPGRLPSPGVFGETPLVSLIDFGAAPRERSGRPFRARPFPRYRLLVACRCGVPPCRFRGCLDCPASAAAWGYATTLLDIELACSAEPMRSW